MYWAYSYYNSKVSIKIFFPVIKLKNIYINSVYILYYGNVVYEKTENGKWIYLGLLSSVLYKKVFYFCVGIGGEIKKSLFILS